MSAAPRARSLEDRDRGVRVVVVERDHPSRRSSSADGPVEGPVRGLPRSRNVPADQVARRATRAGRISATDCATSSAAAPAKPDPRELVQRDERRGEHERGHRDPVHVMQVEPDQQRIAADQRAEQRADACSRCRAVPPASRDRRPRGAARGTAAAASRPRAPPRAPSTSSRHDERRRVVGVEGLRRSRGTARAARAPSTAPSRAAK